MVFWLLWHTSIQESEFNFDFCLNPHHVLGLAMVKTFSNASDWKQGWQIDIDRVLTKALLGLFLFIDYERKDVLPCVIFKTTTFIEVFIFVFFFSFFPWIFKENLSFLAGAAKVNEFDLKRLFSRSWLS